MQQAKIERINVLARKSKTEVLTEAEKEEQAALRREYVAAVKRNLTAQLENTYLVDEKGRKRKLQHK